MRTKHAFNASKLFSVRLESPLELSHLEWVFICIRSSTRNQFGLFVLSQNAVIHAR